MGVVKTPMSSELLKTLFLSLALFTVLFGMGLSLTPADFKRAFLAPLASALGILSSPLVAMPAVVYSLFMFVSGGVMIAVFGRKPVEPVR